MGGITSGQPCSRREGLRLAYLVVIDLFKVRQTIFLVLSGVAAYIIASGGDVDPRVLAFLTAALYLTVSGTTGLNMYYDRDIDSVMERTRCRSLPSGKLGEGTALAVSSIFLALGLLLALMVNKWVLVAGAMGAFVDVYIYTRLLKRRTPLNIVLGSIAGGMPAFGGYVAYTGAPTLEAVLFALLIAEWAIVHIWFISSYYLEDYVKSRVPMLPVVYGFRVTAWASLLVLAGIVATIYTMYSLGMFGRTTLAISLSTSMVVVILGARFAATGRPEIARTAYKALNMFLGATLVTGMAEALA